MRPILLMILMGLSAATPMRAEAQKYADGQYPPGKMYHQEDLKALIGQTLTQPSYLVGEFLYMGLIQGKQMFSTFTALRGDLIGGTTGDQKKIAFGKVLMEVTFDDNFPPGLVVGKAIAPSERSPLLLKRVFAGPDGFVFVQAACESAD